MTARRRTASSRPADAGPTSSAAPGTFTGVAGGSLGTAANLEDTQVYELEDLQVNEPDAPEPVALPEPEAVPMPAAAPAALTAQAPRPTPSPVVAAPVSPVTPMPQVRNARSRPIPGGAIAAAVLVAVIGGAVLLSFANNRPGLDVGTGADAPTAGVTLAPATQPPDEGGGNGGGNGKGNGGGNGKGKPH